MRILFTGASSFTGFWIVKALAAAGHEVFCPLRKAPEAYEGLRHERVKALAASAHLTWPVSFGTPEFLEILKGQEHWDLFCHHAAEVRDYKLPTFDWSGALENNTRGLPAVLRSFSERGGRAALLTGTVFEADEGKGTEPLRAFSPYGLSKGLTWQVFRFYCERTGLALGKFVLPNPFGPYEEFRFTGYLMKEWKQGKPATVKTPEYTRDNIPADLLSLAYAKFAADVTATRKPLQRLSPSCYAETQAAFARRIARETKARLGWGCEIVCARQEDFAEPMVRVNTDPALPLVPSWNETAFWDSYASYYRTQ